MTRCPFEAECTEEEPCGKEIHSNGWSRYRAMHKNERNNNAALL